MSLTRRLATSAISLAVAGVIVAPASAADQPSKLTLAPAVAIVAADQRKLDFLLINSSAESMHITVTTTDEWVLPAESAFDIAPRARHTVHAAVVRHPAYDAGGDHETDVTFAVPPTGADGTIRITWAVAARVIIDTGGRAFHNLRIFGLTAPRIADSFDTPNVNLTLSNRGNVHEIVDVAPFGQVLLLRGQTRVLSLPWTHHPLLGSASISAGGQSVSTLFLPIRAAGGLLAVLVGLLLLRRVRRTTQ